MLLVVSPAKSLDFSKPPAAVRTTQPAFLNDAQVLVDILRQYSPQELSKLMDISDQLASLNVTRFAEWKRPFTKRNAKQAVLAFDGDVYDGLQARNFNEDDLAFVQDHLRILSGLYGVLRPLDLMQAYRLEMGTRLPNTAGRDLYAFWGARITEAINAQLRSRKRAGEEPVLVNLASEEYFKSVKRDLLRGRLIEPVFQDKQSGTYKIISFYAKRARGAMCRYAVLNRITDAEQLKGFNYDGYEFAPKQSNENTWVFRRLHMTER